MLDHDWPRASDDLREFVNAELFLYSKGFKQRASRSDTIKYKIEKILGLLKHKLQSGSNLR